MNWGIGRRVKVRTADHEKYVRNVDTSILVPCYLIKTSAEGRFVHFFACDAENMWKSFLFSNERGIKCFDDRRKTGSGKKI